MSSIAAPAVVAVAVAVAEPTVDAIDAAAPTKVDAQPSSMDLKPLAESESLVGAADVAVAAAAIVPDAADRNGAAAAAAIAVVSPLASSSAEADVTKAAAVIVDAGFDVVAPMAAAMTAASTAAERNQVGDMFYSTLRTKLCIVSK